MRSRYTAYALGDVDYIEATEIEADRKSIEDWVRATRFLALRVLETHGGQLHDQSGRVVFEADYEVSGQRGVHRETSEFTRRDGRWWFVSGRQNPLRQGAKVGRNDPCPCASGKKAKKCCY
jgi:SEC-C motif-containing protein